MATVDTASDLGGHMSLMEHLMELRTRLIRSAIAIAIGAAVGWILYPWVFDILMGPLKELSKNPNVADKLLSLDPLEIFMLRVKMSAYLGIAITMPYLLWQLWGFISPGLHKHERRYALAFVISATVLFLLGALIAFYTLPEALKFLQSLGGDNVYYQYSPQKYLLLIVYMMLAFGLGFQFPIVLVFLQLIGLVSPKQLSSFRRFAIVIIFVVAAVITPSADPISLFALALPMCLFYEISILIGRLVKRRQTKAEPTS